MDTFVRELEKSGDLTGSFSLADIALVLVLGVILSTVLGYAYRYTHRGVSYSQTYVHTLVIIGTVIALVMLVIGSNVARAFALVGSLSIIRFRNAMKEPRDIAFLFCVMAVGMAVGTRFYVLAIIACVALSAIVIAMGRLNLFAKDVRERILRVQLPVDRDPALVLEAPFRDYLVEHRIISLETVRAGVLQEVIYSVVLRNNAAPAQLLEAIRSANDNHKVTLVLGQQEIDI